MFLPINKHILVSKTTQEEKTSSGVLLPESSTQEPAYQSLKIEKVSFDCEKFNNHDLNAQVIAPSNMVIEVEHGGEKFFLVQENYILAMVK